MQVFTNPWVCTGVLLGALLSTGNTLAQAVDMEVAEDLARKSNCTKCHAVLKNRLGPAFHATADKYRDRADAEKVLYLHLTTGPKILVDDEEENHQIVKSTDEAAIQNLVRYILSR